MSERDYNFSEIESSYHGGPKPNLLHLNPFSTYLKKVSFLDGSFEQQDEATHEVIDNLLKPEADAHPQGTE